ncbi:MAG: hypothetical protein K6E37_02275 [Bacteroidales bacterium]|nr:hypothetical protein [Bacteroidales bacterium]
MKNTIIITVMAMFAILPDSRLSAQNRFEAGIGYAPFFLEYVDDGIQFKGKFDAYLEWRYVIGKHFDAGAKLDYKACPISVYDFMDGLLTTGNQHCVSLLANADFNFLPGKKVNPYIGIGMGPALIVNNWTTREQVTPERPGFDYSVIPPVQAYTKFALVVSPRFGVELFSHLRLSVSTDASFNSDIRWPVCLNIGWTF